MQQEVFSDGIAVWPFIEPIVLKVNVQSQTHTCTMLRCPVSYCFSLVWWSLSLSSVPAQVLFSSSTWARMFPAKPLSSREYLASGWALGAPVGLKCWWEEEHAAVPL